MVEKSLSVDNLFVFMLLLAAFSVPPAVQQRVLLYGIVGAVFIEDEASLDGYETAVRALSESSLDSEESKALIARLGEAPWPLEEAV